MAANAHDWNADDRLEAASKQLDRILGFFPRIDAKASFVFAVDSTLLALIALNLKIQDLSNGKLVVPAALAILLIVLSLFFVYRSSFPALKGGHQSLLYFREIAKRREAEYVQLFESVSKEDFQRDLVAQIWRNSEILAVKYASVRTAFILTAFSLIPWFVFLAAVTLIHPQIPLIR